MTFWYFDPEKEIVSRERMGSWKEESFTPADPTLKVGYMVYYTYTTYDSFGRDNDIRYEVIDLYSSEANALFVAEYVANKAVKWKIWNKDIPTKEDGTKIYEVWNNWGIEFHECIVCRVEVQDKVEFKRKVFR